MELGEFEKWLCIDFFQPLFQLEMMKLKCKQILLKLSNENTCLSDPF